MRRVLVITEQIRDSLSKVLTLGNTSYGFNSSEVHSDFRFQNKAKVLKLGDFVDRVRARVGGWEG